MTRVTRVCVLTGLSVIAAMIAADACAQDCPEWLKWTCPHTTSSNPAAGNRIRYEKRLSPPKVTSTSDIGRRTRQPKTVSADTAPTSRPQQRAASEPARPAKAARNTRGPGQSGDRRLVAPGEKLGPRLDHVMNDEQKEVLFQEFLEWQKGRRVNADPNR
jgi:hypothetical protein